MDGFFYVTTANFHSVCRRRLPQIWPMMPAWMLWEVQYDLICSEMIVYTLWSMAILPTREHLKMHAFLSFALRHVDDFGGLKSITYSNALYRVSITNSKFQARNYSDVNQRSSSR